MGRKKKEIRLKEPVRIREKKIAGGNISLYLDIYQKGLRKKETLKLYLVPEINAATKLQNGRNRQTLWGGCTDANPKLLLNDT